MKRLETERLLLRPFTIDDAGLMFNNWANDDEVTKYLTWPSHKSINDTINILGEWIQNHEKNDFYNWAIVLKEINEPVGSISVVKQDDDIGMVRIGYCIGRKWWNRGITSEALGALIEFFFVEAGINRIEAMHDSNNPISGKVMAKCGMKYEGLMRQAGRNNQGICDDVIYGILADDWRTSKNGSPD